MYKRKKIKISEVLESIIILERYYQVEIDLMKEDKTKVLQTSCTQS